MMHIHTYKSIHQSWYFSIYDDGLVKTSVFPFWFSTLSASVSKAVKFFCNCLCDPRYKTKCNFIICFVSFVIFHIAILVALAIYFSKNQWMKIPKIRVTYSYRFGWVHFYRWPKCILSKSSNKNLIFERNLEMIRIFEWFPNILIHVYISRKWRQYACIIFVYYG